MELSIKMSNDGKKVPYNNVIKALINNVNSKKNSTKK